MSLPQPPQIPVIVTVTDESMSSLQEVAKQLEMRGFTITHLLKYSGQIMGTTSPQAIGSLNNVPGVSGVEASSDIQIAPPDSEIQ